jgi:hypothetical protein
MAKDKTPKVRILTADELVAEIAKTLKEWDDLLLEDTANDILSEKVEYIGDSQFRVTPYKR